MYRPSEVIKFYSTIGDLEWQRLGGSAYDRLVFELLAGVLRPHLDKGKRVLDAGCGAGLFSVLAAQAGASVSIIDLCPAQVNRAVKAIDQRGLGDRVETALTGDLLDLSAFPNDVFDTSICLGVLNYLGGFASKGLRELIRVTRDDGVIIVSVLSRYGALRFSLANEQIDIALLLQCAESLRVSGGEQPLNSLLPATHLFSSTDFTAVLKHAGIDSFNLLSIPAIAGGLRERIECASKDSNTWERLLRLETEASRIPGMVDAGEQLVAEILPLSKATDIAGKMNILAF